MNVLGKPTYLESTARLAFLTLWCAIKAIQLKPECYLSSVICLPKVRFYMAFCIILFSISPLCVFFFLNLVLSNQFLEVGLLPNLLSFSFEIHLFLSLSCCH